MVKALKLVLGDEPISARQACRDIFGEDYPTVQSTLGNLYKKTFGGESIHWIGTETKSQSVSGTIEAAR